MAFEEITDKIGKTAEKAGRTCLRIVITFLIWTGCIIIFLTLNFIFRIPWYWTVLTGVVLIFIIALITKIKNAVKKAKLGKINVKGTNVTVLEFDQLIKDGRDKISKIKILQNRINNFSVKNKIREIADITKKIYDNLESDPKNINSARQFINYYFDASVKVINKYVELSGHKDLSINIEQSLRNVESSLDVIIKAFRFQLQKQLEDNAMNIDVELKVLNDILKSEGLK